MSGPRRKVYIAAPLLHVRVAQELSDGLLLNPHYEVVSTWHAMPYATVALEEAMTVDRQKEVARTCLAEVTRCDVLLLLYGAPSHRVGSIFEAGMATALGRLVVATPLSSEHPLPTILLLPGARRVASMDVLREALRDGGYF
jgi:nucleoside 2-deoxyribosyltransferase